MGNMHCNVTLFSRCGEKHLVFEAQLTEFSTLTMRIDYTVSLVVVTVEQQSKGGV